MPKDFVNSTSTSIETIRDRLHDALCTIPTPEAWLQTAALLLVLTLIALPIGLQLGFLKVEAVNGSWNVVVLMANCLFTPAISEELFFRVLLIPQSAVNSVAAVPWFWGSLSLVIFIAYHPLIGMRYFSPGRTTFKDPVFLLLAALLGITCTIAYLWSGSLWPPVAIHWLAVVAWLLWLGGYKKLSTE